MTRIHNRIIATFSLLSLTALLACGGEEAATGSTGTAATGGSASQGSTQEAAPLPTGTASKVGDTMPDYSANELDGGTWQLSDEKGVTMINLWATWCGPCRYEIPALIKLQKEYGEQGLQVVGVSMDQAGMEQQIESFARNAGINYKIVHDPQATLAEVFDTTIIPTTALVDRNGKVVWYHAGIVSNEDPELLEALKDALATTQAATNPHF